MKPTATGSLFSVVRVPGMRRWIGSGGTMNDALTKLSLVLTLPVMLVMAAACGTRPAAAPVTSPADPLPGQNANSTPEVEIIALTAAPSPIPSPTPIPTRTPVPTATPAPDPVVSSQARRVMEIGQPDTLEIMTSPDGRWRAELVRYDCVAILEDEVMAYELLRLVQLDGGSETLLVDQLQNCGGLGAAGLGIVYWSADSRYLYYTESAHGQPDGDATGWYRSLFRYDLVEEETISLRWGPLAPDGVTMAYPDPEEATLILWDLERGEIARIPSSLPAGAPGAAIYGIAWAPDGGSLVYIEAGNFRPPAVNSWLVRLDFDVFEREVIYQADDAEFCCVEWQALGQIQFLEDWQPMVLALPETEPRSETPGGLWCERPDDLAEKTVDLARLPGAPESFCIVWKDSSTKEITGYRVELSYDNGNELFEYIAGLHGNQWIVPFEYRPRLDESQEQFMRRRSLSVSVYALRSGRETLVGGMGRDVDNYEFQLLPTATSSP